MLNALIVGGGPSGLAAAYEISQLGAKALVLERLDQVGGLSRTLSHEGCHFDVGPHRFFTKNEEVKGLFESILVEDIVRVRRFTRILYEEKLFNYPLTPLNALSRTGGAASAAILLSYLYAQFRNFFWPREPVTFEQWVIDHFGARLFETFFRTYTEKVWGIPCSQIGADWAGQRIKSLSLGKAVWNALTPKRTQDIKTLVDEFLYPRLGAGMLYQKMARAIETRGGQVQTHCPVARIRREGHYVRSMFVVDADGNRNEIEAEQFLSSAPLSDTAAMMEPRPPQAVLEACRCLRYRNHIGVNLKIEGASFPDHWIYVHDKRLRMARVSNYRNFSVAMADQDNISPITAEYFCFHGDEMWCRTDEEIVALAGHELERAGLVKRSQVRSGFVVRSEKAYPVIECGFQRHVNSIKTWLDQFQNFLPIGRSGMFKYNNQDHAMATGLLAARTVLGCGRYDPWLVNIDAEYTGKTEESRSER